MRPHSHHPPKISSCILLIYSLILVIIDQLSLSVILYKSNNKVYTFLSFKKCLVFIHIIFRNANKTRVKFQKEYHQIFWWSFLLGKGNQRQQKSAVDGYKLPDPQHSVRKLRINPCRKIFHPYFFPWAQWFEILVNHWKYR